MPHQISSPSGAPVSSNGIAPWCCWLGHSIRKKLCQLYWRKNGNESQLHHQCAVQCSWQLTTAADSIGPEELTSVAGSARVASVPQVLTKIDAEPLSHYDWFLWWDFTKKGQWALYVYSIAIFVASWLKWMIPNDFKWIQMTSVDFLDTYRLLWSHFRSFWVI